MLHEKQLPIFGTLDTDPDSIPRGFIHREPDMLNVQQQKKLNEMKVKMIDFNEEYIAKHPQLEALVQLLISELIIHKPYYVRDFIKEILSREDLETQIALIIAAKQLNLNRQHTSRYFAHTQVWQDKAAGKNEPEVIPEDPLWPEPCPYRKDTRRDKREYCHPHYFKVPYVFAPKEFLKPKLPNFKKKKYPQFHSKLYAKLVLENFKDIWGDPVTNFPPPMNDEELYTAHAVLSKKHRKDMTNDELIKTCIYCRRLNLRNYLYAMNKKEYFEKPKQNPYKLVIDTIPLRVANKIIEKAIQAVRKGDIRNTTHATVKKKKFNKDLEMDYRLMKFEKRFVAHRPLVDWEKYGSPIPGMTITETGVIEELLPLSDLGSTKSVEKIPVKELRVRSQIKPHHQEQPPKQEVTMVIVPTTDLKGNLVSQSLVELIVEPVENKGKYQEKRPVGHLPVKEKTTGIVEDTSVSLSSTRFDDKYLTIEKQKIKKVVKSNTYAQPRESEITIVSRKKMLQEVPSIHKKVMIKDLEGNVHDSYIAMHNISSDRLMHNEQGVSFSQEAINLQLQDIDIIKLAKQASVTNDPPSYLARPILELKVKRPEPKTEEIHRPKDCCKDECVQIDMESEAYHLIYKWD